MRKVSDFNIPNSLTVARMILLIPFMISFIIGGLGGYISALVIIVLASITDYLDGTIARSYKTETDFGKFMDPLADKILTIPIFFSYLYFLYRGYSIYPLFICFPILILTRELSVTWLRRYARKKNSEMKTMSLGKSKTILQLITIGSVTLMFMAKELIIRRNNPDTLPSPDLPVTRFFAEMLPKNGWILEWLPFSLMSIVVVITVISGVHYFMVNTHLFKIGK